MSKNNELILEARNSPPPKRINAKIDPDKIDTLPEANGLKRFLGWDLSEFKSAKSFIK